MKKKSLQVFLAICLLLLLVSYALAHCEIPCGIYGDQMRVDMIAEHIATIEKAMQQILRLQDEKPLNHNQVARWIMNKELHATELQHIISQYFMTQRIKFDTDKYAEKLALLHKMLVYAMKCKQTLDLAHVGALRSVLEEFQTLYFGKRTGSLHP